MKYNRPQLKISFLQWDHLTVFDFYKEHLKGTQKAPEKQENPKPVTLVEWCIKNSSKIWEIVIDLFLWSWATIVACENLGRICYACELEPKYCQVSIDRIMSINPNYKVKINGIDI